MIIINPLYLFHSCTKFAGIKVSGIRYQVSSIRYQVSSIRHYPTKCYWAHTQRKPVL